MGINGSDGWDLIGTVGPGDFPDLTSIAAGDSVEVYALWTPEVTPPEGSRGVFPFHSCVRVIIPPVAGERVLPNGDGNGEQENISYFEARATPGAAHASWGPTLYGPIHGEFNLVNILEGLEILCSGSPADRDCDEDVDLDDYNPFSACMLGPSGTPVSDLCNPFDFDNNGAVDLRDFSFMQLRFGGPGPRWFRLVVDSGLPPGWTADVAGGQRDFLLAPAEVRKIPITIQVPPGAPVGQRHFVDIAAFVEINGFTPNHEPHVELHRIGGVTIAAQTVIETSLSLDAVLIGAAVDVAGAIAPVVPNAPVSIEYRGLGDTTITQLTTTNPSGTYAATQALTLGSWNISAVWAGSETHSWAESPEVRVEVFCGNGSCDADEDCFTCSQDCGCDDGNVCTDDVCDLTSECVGGKVEGMKCTTDQECFEGLCEVVGCRQWNNIEPCDDGDACTTSDTCAGGTCLGGPPPNCNDGNVCTNDSCDPAAGCQHVNNAASCDDGDACTTNDTCAGATCTGWTPVNCNDANVCTDDSCDPAAGCQHVNNTASCDDGDVCTTNDACAGGTCLGGPPPNCNDGNVCTNDSCDPAAGCQHVNNAESCDDGDVCTDDSCDPVTGCQSVNNTASCDDGNVCTDDSCDPAAGCQHVNNAASCNDGAFCNGSDTCNGGICVHSGDPCAGGPECKDTCNEGDDSCFTPPNTPCTDDGEVCTDNVCNGNGFCVQVANNAACDDGNFCNGDDQCSNGKCLHLNPPCFPNVCCADESCCPMFTTCCPGFGCCPFGYTCTGTGCQCVIGCQ